MTVWGVMKEYETTSSCAVEVDISDNNEIVRIPQNDL